MAGFLEISSSRRIDSMESGMSSEDVPAHPPAFFTPKRLFAVGAGLLGLAGCAAAAAVHAPAASSAPVGEQPGAVGALSARSLLEHPDFIDVAANNVWVVAGQHLAGKEHKLRPAMREVMSKVTSMLNEHDPEGGRQLEAMKLTHQQKGDVLSMVKKMSDKRVQGVGKEILEIALKHQNDKDSAMNAVQRDISSAFQPRMEELRTLKSSVVPASLRDVEEKSAVLPVQQRRLNSSSHASSKDCVGDTSQCNPGSELTSTMGKHMDMKMEDALGIVGGLLEQARLALDESAVIGGAFGSTHHVPYYWRSLIGGAAFGVETVDCFMRQNDKHEEGKDGKMHLVNSESSQVNSVKEAMCPMKYAGAGMDFLSGLNNAMGIQNTRLPQDFQTMFGGATPAAPQAGYNPYAAQHNAYANVMQHAAAANPFAMFAKPAAAPQPQPPAHPLVQMAHGFLHGMQNAQTAAVAATPAAQPWAYHR